MIESWLNFDKITTTCVVGGVQKQRKLCPFFEKMCKGKTRFIIKHVIGFE
ncbi:hypothetical protein HanXRQr2_Chr04g0180021 [Helianthus annuus]|uniref:Uncharacterized protein n=1 Tax=Helianthus annuus TaxID=4232 RepID=A0A9K3J9I1_HELAN|nr:hypothetical protein HanXRQr2_Chr04g0180021 [Helianthus annuus]KAJ0581978.1 hypothetical protein HanHA300_Chr04g0147181 [Helianthus annuus]KAJ0597961.1 hypothetical protein HanHA89_Chr04g0160541 [Helianthus annuus]KAJ0758590.1 hypothetical protein HanLR1_Chr04g0152101 [Helianthus annuus]KAJ0932423.1 hypothetical protein HanPSC8_Chr04g0173481 [Helianthus annuus]